MMGINKNHLFSFKLLHLFPHLKKKKLKSCLSILFSLPEQDTQPWPSRNSQPHRKCLTSLNSCQQSSIKRRLDRHAGWRDAIGCLGYKCQATDGSPGQNFKLNYLGFRMPWGHYPKHIRTHMPIQGLSKPCFCKGGGALLSHSRWHNLHSVSWKGLIFNGTACRFANP